MAIKPLPAPQRQSASVWWKTKQKTVESRDPKARRVAETSGNSKRTQTWIITECSNGDVQVLRTVNNGVSTVAPLSQNSKVIRMTGMRVDAQRRPIFDKAEDLDKAYKQQTKIWPEGRGKMQLTMKKAEHNL